MPAEICKFSSFLLTNKIYTWPVHKTQYNAESKKQPRMKEKNNFGEMLISILFRKHGPPIRQRNVSEISNSCCPPY